MSADVPPVEWRTVDKGHLNSEREDFRVTFKHGGRDLKRFDHPHRSADHVRRRLRRLATELTVTDLRGPRWTADLRLVDAADRAPFRSSILFWEYPDGPVDAQAFRIRLPPATVPEDVYQDVDEAAYRAGEFVPHREAVKAVAAPLVALRPPTAGTYVYVGPGGYPHVVYGDTSEPRANDDRIPAEALLGFLADLKPAVERVLDGGEWRAR